MTFQPTFSGVAHKNGGTAETGRQGKTHMLQIPEKPGKANLLTKVGSEFITASPDKKAAEWLEGHIAKSQDKVTTVVADLTPALARVLLERNDANRKFRQTIVDAYARDIKNGKWDFNGEPIIISRDGKLNDGGHRIRAVIAANVAVPVVFVIGVERETRMTLDQGAVRTLADYLAMDGRTYTLQTSSMSGYVWWFSQTGSIVKTGHQKPTKSELFDLIEKHIGAFLTSIKFCDHKGARALGGTPLLAFVHWAIRRQCADKAEADNFMLGLLEGAGLKHKSPILYVRNRITAEGRKNHRGAKAELMFKAWNAYRRGETVKQFYIIGGPLPRLEK